MNKPLSKTTLKQVLDKYKDILGNAGTEEFICNAIEKIYNKNTANLFRELVEEQIGDEILKSENKNLLDEQKRIIAIDMIQKSYDEAATKADDAEDLKRWIIAELYRQYENKLSDKQKQDLERLILNGDKIYLYRYKSNSNPNFNDCKLFSREPKEKLEGEEEINSYKGRFICALNILEAPAINGIIKEEYKEEVMDLIMSQYGREYLFEVNAINKDGIINNKADINLDEVDENNIEIFLKKVRGFLKDNFEYVDKEQLILNFVGKLILGLKVKKGESIKSITVNSQLSENEEKGAIKTSIQIIKIIEQELSKKIYEGKSHDIISHNDEIIYTVSLEKIREFLKSCTEDKYINEKDVKEIHNNIEKGILPDDFQELEIANVNIDDFYKLLETYNKETNDLKTKENLYKSLVKLLNHLIEMNQISEKEILKLGINGKVNLEILKEIELKKIEPEKYDKLLENAYFQFVFTGEGKSEKEKLEKVSKIYKIMQEKGYIHHSQDEVIEKITSLYNEENLDEIIKDLYKFGLIDEEKLVEWLAGDALIEIYKNDRYMPAQFKGYEENGLIGIKDIIKFVNSLPDNNVKWFEIGNIYPGDSEIDVEKRKKLYDGCIKVQKTAKGGQKGNSINSNPNAPVQGGDSYITDPYARMQLIGLIDTKAISKLTSDGHWIVELPKFNEVIIEKVLDENGEISYGNATFILPKKIYTFRKHKFLKNDKIVRSKIVEEITNGNASKIEHFITTWGTKLKEHFDIKEGSMYDKEKIEEIDYAIERVKNSRKKREK